MSSQPRHINITIIAISNSHFKISDLQEKSIYFEHSIYSHHSCAPRPRTTIVPLSRRVSQVYAVWTPPSLFRRILQHCHLPYSNDLHFHSSFIKCVTLRIRKSCSIWYVLKAFVSIYISASSTRSKGGKPHPPFFLTTTTTQVVTWVLRTIKKFLNSNICRMTIPLGSTTTGVISWTTAPVISV